MTLLNTLKAGRIALAVVAFSAAAMAVAPAQAAGFQFNFDLGNGGMHMKKMCLSDDQILEQLDNAGWHQVNIVNENKFKVIAVGRWHHDWFQLLIDRCTGKIVKKPADFDHHHDHHHDHDDNIDPNDFHITLSF